MTEEIIDASNRTLFNWKELWRYRELFYFFTWRDIKVKYKQTILGFLWAILQPLIMMLILTLFFGRVCGMPSQNLTYSLYVFSGLLIWNIFSTGLTTASNSMVNNSTIIKKLYFPRLVIPASSILVSLFDFLMAFVLFAALLFYYQQPVSWNALVMWPLAIFMTVIATMGIGCWLAALNVKYRDFRYVIPFLVQVLFFLTPVMYPVSMIKYEGLQYVLVCSPIFAAVELFRYPLTNEAPNEMFILISIVSGIFFLFAGLIYFRKTEDYFADLA